MSRTPLPWLLLAAGGLLLTAGCKKTAPPPASPPPAASGSATGAPPATPPDPPPEPTAEPAPPTAPTPTTAPPPPQPDPRAALADTLQRVYCLLSRRSRSGSREVYREAGFDDASAFAEAFQKARAADPEWAERTLAAVVTASCTASK